MHRVAKLGYFKLYYAKRSVFRHPGFHLWTGKRHIRVFPLPRAKLPPGARRECRHGILFDCPKCWFKR